VTTVAYSVGVLGTMSGVAAGVGSACYVTSWLRSRAMPNRISWTVFSLIYVAAFTALLIHRAAWPLLVMPGESAIGCTVILILSLRRGSGDWDATAWALTGSALLAVPVWLLYPHAVAAVALSAAAELAGDVPTIAGAWRDRDAEPISSWGCVAVSGALATAAAIGTHSALIGFLLPAAWMLGGTAIPAAARLGEWARKGAGQRRTDSAALARVPATRHRPLRPPARRPNLGLPSTAATTSATPTPALYALRRGTPVKPAPTRPRRLT